MAELSTESLRNASAKEIEEQLAQHPADVLRTMAATYMRAYFDVMSGSVAATNALLEIAESHPSLTSKLIPVAKKLLDAGQQGNAVVGASLKEMAAKDD